MQKNDPGLSGPAQKIWQSFARQGKKMINKAAAVFHPKQEKTGQKQQNDTANLFVKLRKPLALAAAGAALAAVFLLEPLFARSKGRELDFLFVTAAATTGWPTDGALSYHVFLNTYSAMPAVSEALTVKIAPQERIPLSTDMFGQADTGYTITEKPSWFSVDLAALSGSGSQRASYLKNYVNSDVFGWLTVPGTNIDYPILQGPTLEYYLARDLYKNSSRNGVLWVDSDANDYSTNTVVFGHNWSNLSSNPHVGRANDVMFAQLPAFHHLWFAREVPYFYYSTPTKDMVCQIFAVFYTTDTSFYVLTRQTGSSLQGIIDKAKRLSLHSYNVSVDSSDKIITLSTCTRALHPTNENQRFVVMAKVVSSGSSSVYIN